MIKVLLTGGGGAGNEALWRLLGNCYELHFGDADVSTIDPSIPENRRHQLPWASDPDFPYRVAAICKRVGIDLLVPGVDEELPPLARHAGALVPTLLMLPGGDYVELMLDKLLMANALLQKGIPVPATHPLTSGFGEVSFPCIVKPRKGRGSRGVRVVGKLEAPDLLRALGGAAGDYVVQEKVEGVEFTVQMIADRHARLAAIVPVRVDLKRGISIQAEVVAEPDVIAACLAIHNAIPAAGCYNIQLMLCADGLVLPFEINPRISTTFCLTVAAGVDPIAVFLGKARMDGLLPYEVGMQLRRHWTNHFPNKSV